MATARELKNKIRSVKNTQKITRTMEMISTAKARVCQKRIEAAQPYGDRLAHILQDLKSAGADATHPLLRVPEETRSEVLFVITANRGLCGGYNSNVLRVAERYLDRRQAEGVEVEVHMIGKKGIARFRYTQREVHKKYIDFDDQSTFAQAEAAIQPMLERYAAGDIDAVSVVFTHYMNSARQQPVARAMLPIPTDEGGKGKPAGNFMLEPSPEAILESLLPLSLKTQLFQALLEAVTGEQIARRNAMKSATDNASEMQKKYTQLYNRNRQASITQEILEVIGGSSA